MIIAACKSDEENSHVVEYLIDMGGDINLQDNVSFNYNNLIIFIATMSINLTKMKYWCSVKQKCYDNKY